MTDYSGPWCYGLAQHEYLVLSVPVQTDKDSNLQNIGYLSHCMAVRHEH